MPSFSAIALKKIVFKISFACDSQWTCGQILLWWRDRGQYGLQIDVCSTAQISIDNFNAESTSENDSSSPSNVSGIEEENETLDEHSIAYY